MASLVDKYRPSTWDDFVGQEHIINFFKSIIKTPEKFPKNIILNGPHGTGKTTSARIFAQELNNLYKSHIYEFDSTVIDKKDDLKNIKSRIDNQFKFSKDFRILIFDEIQSVPQAAQSVFMKTLEDNIKEDGTDRNLYFLFLTTDSSKIIPTIKSRCIEINFYFISDEQIKNRVENICKIENIEIDDRTLNKIVDLSEGHLRDAIVLLDKYNIVKDGFFDLILDSQELLYQHLFTDVDTISKIKVFPVNNLVKDLNKVIERYINDNIDQNYIFILQFMEVYLKYKKYVYSIEDFISVLKIMKKFIKMKRGGGE